MKNHRYIAFSQYMMFVYKTAEFALVWTTILKIRAIFVHQTLTEQALYENRSEAVLLMVSNTQQ